MLIEGEIIGNLIYCIGFMYPLQIPCSFNVLDVLCMILTLEIYYIFKAFILEIFIISLFLKEYL